MSWIYCYINGAQEEIDMGPWDTYTEAEQKMNEHAGFGAMCKGPIEVDPDYELYKGDEPDE